jgi:VanZ family protein
VIRRVWLLFGWLGVLLTLAMSLGPPALDEGSGQTDKFVHLAGYAVLMFWWAQIIVARRWRLALAVVLFGLAIEGLQSLTPDRLADAADALANSTGAVLGWVTASLLPNLPARLAALSPIRNSRL